jgi:hypothetical protein
MLPVRELLASVSNPMDLEKNPKIRSLTFADFREAQKVVLPNGE